MTVLMARLRSVRQEVLFELQRFVVLWRYRHQVPPFALWWRIVLKRVVDLVGGLTLLALCSPLMAILAFLVKLDSPGPILFGQERMGRLGRNFRILKFRSMVQDAEVKTGPVWCARQNDPRVTPFGRFLRRSHLDELPQLFNVIRGDMSLVGPRPERPCFVEQLVHTVPAYDQRLFVKPGMTGLAQVHYRYDQSLADVKRKLRFDLLYVKRMCLMLDVRILAWTAIVVITGRGIK
jgi:lipopolysaccharide/colanic/teichoic acid biosynthesis glycosyltransferase